jgi:antitoxin component of MazEF toxin-antitoxin module
MTRKLIKAGESVALLIDSELEALTGLSLGDKVKVEIKSDGVLVLHPLGKRTKKDKPRLR